LICVRQFRYQKPSVFRTKSKRPEWYFRARVDVLVAPGETARPQKPFYLGFCDEMGKREAEKARDVILSEGVNQPQVMIQSQVKFSTVIDAYRKDHIPNLRQVTGKSYESRIKHVEKAFGELRLCDITPQVVQRWCNGLPASQRRQVVLHFNLIWKKARAWGYTQMNTPAEFVSYGQKAMARPKAIPTVDQYFQLRAALPAPLDVMADIAVTMGMRISEIRGLPARCVDLKAGSVRVEQRLDELDNLDDPKSFRGQRVLPIGSLRPVFQRAIAGKRPDEFVFSGFGYWYALDELKAAAKAVGFESPRFGWHTLRRCHNTWIPKGGASQQDAMDRMGHASAAVNDLYMVQESEDFARREKITRALQDKLIGKPAGGIQ
jgi:integrase